MDEFKTMVKTPTRRNRGDPVVYNHTAEGNHLGPTLCFRGIDNVNYYKLVKNKRYYMDYTRIEYTMVSALSSIADGQSEVLGS